MFPRLTNPVKRPARIGGFTAWEIETETGVVGVAFNRKGKWSYLLNDGRQGNADSAQAVIEVIA